MSFSRDGSRFAFASLDFRSTILRVAFDTARGTLVGAPEPILKSNLAIRDHELSPDGGWIAFTTSGPQEDLFVARPDGRDYQNRITYDEIVRPERLVYHQGGGDDVEPVQFRTTVTFEDLGGKDSDRKTRLTLHAVFPSAAERDRVIKEYGADKGAVQTLSRLADYLTAMAS